MCGIAGLFNLDRRPVERAHLVGMIDALVHRGPDGAGVHVDGALGLGHRRLSIIDLSDAARQPMAYGSERYWISYNGELYNFRELRAQLIKLGHAFRSDSDTEVVLAAFAEWGTACFARFNGMFAMAIWDSRDRRLVLARDRYGIKPLYYLQGDHGIAFGSEQKAILSLPSVRRRIDFTGMAEYLTFQNFFSDRTLLEGMRMFPPGCWTAVEEGATGGVRPERYWDFDFREPDGPVSEQEISEELDRLFRQAVERQLVSDVEVGAYLSGGLDSGAITAIAARHSPYIKSFTCGFDLHSASGIELGFDERTSAEHMSYLFRTEHYEMVLKAGDLERVMPRLAWHIEEPRVGQSYPNFYVAQLASKFVKVVLAGTGGDELFGGYPWRYYRAVVNDDFDHYIDKYLGFWQRLVPQDTLPRLLAPVWDRAAGFDARNAFKSVFREHSEDFNRPEDYVNHSLYFEAKTFLHGLLVVEDKLSMAHGLESRVPFLDNDLVDFASRIPVRMKLRDLESVVKLNENDPGPKSARYFEKTHDGKLIFRKAMARHVPEKVREGFKQGFSAPDASWFRGDSIEYVRKTLLASDAAIASILDPATVRALLDDHFSGRVNRRLLVWSLISLENWMQAFNPTY